MSAKVKRKETDRTAVVLGERPDHAAGGLVPQAVPAQDRQQPQADGSPPEHEEHDVGERGPALSEW